MFIKGSKKATAKVYQLIKLPVDMLARSSFQPPHLVHVKGTEMFVDPKRNT